MSTVRSSGGWRTRFSVWSDAACRQSGQARRSSSQLTREILGGGYAGCFQALDGHLWEVSWNPQWTVQAECEKEDRVCRQTNVNGLPSSSNSMCSSAALFAK